VAFLFVFFVVVAIFVVVVVVVVEDLVLVVCGMHMQSMAFYPSPSRLAT